MIIRRKLSANYTVIPNAIFADERLNPDHLGVLCYLLSRPDDWAVRQTQLAARFKVGKDKMQGIVRSLIEAGYIIRVQNRSTETKTFGEYEYHVYDTPQGTGEPANSNEPLPENPATAGTSANRPPKAKTHRPKVVKPTAEPLPEKPWPENPPLLNTDLTNPPSEGLTPPKGLSREKAGEELQAPTSTPLTLNARIWGEAKAILQPREFGCVTGWLQRVAGKPNGPETLLGIIETARKQGTLQPVPYITAALNREFPPPPDPKAFDRAKWELVAKAAVNTKAWGDWGPRPGERGCLMPLDLITPDLIRAVSVRRVA